MACRGCYFWNTHPVLVRRLLVLIASIIGLLVGWLVGHKKSAVALALLCSEVFPLLAYLKVSDIAFQSYRWHRAQLLLETKFVVITSLPFVAPWGFMFYWAPEQHGVHSLVLAVVVAVGLLMQLICGGIFQHFWGGLWLLLLGFADFVVPAPWVPPEIPMQCGFTAVMFFLSCCCTYQKDRCTLCLYGALQGICITVGRRAVDDQVQAVISLLNGILCAYALMFWTRWRRVMPPGLKGCKFVRLDALRGMVERGERIRRCQDLPESAFGDSERARYLVVVSHRWIDRRWCDVATPEHPAGLRLETMVKKLEGFFSPRSFWKGGSLRERLRNTQFSMAAAQDVLVFFDFMSMPQIGTAPDGTPIPRTEAEQKVFNECLANMGVLYSMFQVLVCDEVPEGVPSYMDSGWCFSELVTATLGRRLNVYSRGYLTASEAMMAKWRPKSQGHNVNFDELLEPLTKELEGKVFQDDGDRAVVRSIVKAFLLKSLLLQAIRRRDVDQLSRVLDDLETVGVQNFLDQPVDNKLNTPLHKAISKHFTAGALLLIERGARLNLKNLRGDTPLQRFAFPRVSRTAFACRLAAGLDGLAGRTPEAKREAHSLTLEARRRFFRSVSQAKSGLLWKVKSEIPGSSADSTLSSPRRLEATPSEPPRPPPAAGAAASAERDERDVAEMATKDYEEKFHGDTFNGDDMLWREMV